MVTTRRKSKAAAAAKQPEPEPEEEVASTSSSDAEEEEVVANNDDGDDNSSDSDGDDDDDASISESEEQSDSGGGSDEDEQPSNDNDNNNDNGSPKNDIINSEQQQCTFDLHNLLAFNTHQINAAELYNHHPTTTKKKASSNSSNKHNELVNPEWYTVPPTIETNAAKMPMVNESLLLSKAAEGTTQLLAELWKLPSEKVSKILFMYRCFVFVD